MTTEYLLFMFLMVIVGIALMSQFKKGLLYIFSDSLIWLWLAFYLINGNAGFWAPWDIAHKETYFLICALFMLVFAILFSWMNIELRHEAGGLSWKTWGAPPAGEKTTRAQEYKKYLRKRGR